MKHIIKQVEFMKNAEDREQAFPIFDEKGGTR